MTMDPKGMYLSLILTIADQGGLIQSTNIPKGFFEDVKMTQWKFHNALEFFKLVTV